jgi:hypothetical protein
MTLARLGRHDDALAQLQAVQDLAIKRASFTPVVLLRGQAPNVPDLRLSFAPPTDQKVEVAFNLAVLLAHMDREEDAARAWLPARGQSLDKAPDYYQRWVASVSMVGTTTGYARSPSFLNFTHPRPLLLNASRPRSAEAGYREMDRALGEVWRRCRSQQMLQELASLDSLSAADFADP